MPGLSGVELTRLVMEQLSPPAVVCLTALADEQTMRDALEAGACGFVSKTNRPEVIIHGIRSAFTGESVVSPRLLATVLATIAKRGRTPKNLDASDRELLRHIGHGLSNAEIAPLMFLSPATIKTYVNRLLTKTPGRNRAQLAVCAHHWGLMNDEGISDT